jgi:hypothetical protein
LAQGRSDGSEDTPEHMGESTLRAQGLLLYRTRGMPMPDSRSAQRGEMPSLCLAHIQGKLLTRAHLALRLHRTYHHSGYHPKDQECANCNRKLDHELVSTSLCLSLNAAGMLRLSLNSFELPPLPDDERRALPITLFLNGSLPRV